MRENIIFITGLSLLSGISIAQSIPVAPQPTSCIDSNFLTMQRSKYAVGQTVALKLTNHCGHNVDLQNASITFLNTKNVNALFWGNFSPLSYPTNPDMSITSKPSDDQYLSTLSLQYDVGSNSRTVLPDDSDITIYYTVKQASYVNGSVKVYLNSAVNTGSIRIINTTPQPENVNEFYTIVNVSLNGHIISKVPLSWSGEQVISGLAPGEYDISPVNIASGDEDHLYEASGPSKLVVTSGEIASAYINYAEKIVMGSIGIKLQELPQELIGYEETPKITLIREDNNSAQISDVAWGTVFEAPRLATNKVQYHFSTADINYNGFTCSPVFDPVSFTTKTNHPIVTLNYNCIKTAQDNVTLRIVGAPSALSSVNVLFTPNGNADPITQTIHLVNGEGSTMLAFTEGGIYTVSSDTVDGYTAAYSSHLLTVTGGAEEVITYSKIQPEVVTEPEVTTPVVVEPTEPEVVTEPEVTTPVVVEPTEPEVVTEPEVTTPVVVEPTEPEVVTEPEVTTPVVVEPTEPEVVTEPEVTTPIVVEPTEPEVVTEPEVTTPVVVEPTEPEVVTEPEVTTPVVVEPTEPEVVTEPEVTTPVVVEPTEPEVVTEPEVTTPVVVEPTEPEVVTEPEVTTPVVVEPTDPEVVTEPEVTTPVVVEPTDPEVVTEPEVATPVVVEPTEPEVVTEPEVTTPVVVEPTEPEVVTEPEVTTPVVVEPTEPEVVTEPEVATPVVVEPTDPEVVTEPEVKKVPQNNK